MKMHLFKLFSLVLLLNLSCSDILHPGEPDLTGVWKCIERTNDLKTSLPETIDYRSDIREFMIISNNKIVQKYTKDCFCKVWSFDLIQDGMTFYKTLSKSPCRSKFTVAFNRDTLLITIENSFSKWILCDSLTEPNWKTINSFTDMEELAPYFCMVERNPYWADPIDERSVSYYEELAHYAIADTIDFFAENKILCDTGSFFYLLPIIPNNESVDSFYWYFDGTVKSNEMYAGIWGKERGLFDVMLCVKFRTGRRACMFKPAYLQVL